MPSRPEVAELLAWPRTPNEGPMHLQNAERACSAATDCTGSSARKEGGPQDDSLVGCKALNPVLEQRSVSANTPFRAERFPFQLSFL